MPMTCVFLNDLRTVDFISSTYQARGLVPEGCPFVIAAGGSRLVAVLPMVPDEFRLII